MSELAGLVDELKLYIKKRDYLALSELLEEVERSAAQNSGQHDPLLDELEIQTECAIARGREVLDDEVAMDTCGFRPDPATRSGMMPPPIPI